jgi:hypothetical protein
VKTIRIFLAASAAAALMSVGAVVALAAPDSLGRAASPEGGAARAVYCPNGMKRQLNTSIAGYRKRMAADRARYSKTHRSKAQRAAFARLQNQQLSGLQKKLRRCS